MSEPSHGQAQKFLVPIAQALPSFTMASKRVTPMIPSMLTGVVKEINDAISSLYDKLFGPLASPVMVYAGPPASGDKTEPILYGPVQTCLDAPSMAKPMYDSLVGLTQLQGITLKARETIILVTAAAFQCTYIRYAHERIGMAQPCNLTKGQVQSLSHGKKPTGTDELDEMCDMAFDIGTELCCQQGQSGRLSSALWDRAVGSLGKEGTLALVHWAGYYAYMSMLMNACDCPLPEGESFI